MTIEEKLRQPTLELQLKSKASCNPVTDEAARKRSHGSREDAIVTLMRMMGTEDAGQPDTRAEALPAMKEGDLRKPAEIPAEEPGEVTVR